MNSVGNVYCDKCNARLIPMAALPLEEPEREPAPIKGLSLPTIPLEEEGEPQVEDLTEETRAEGEAVDDWLAQIRASTVEEAEEPKKPEITADVEPTEIPDWLRAGKNADFRTSTDQAPAAAEIPDWLREIAPPEEAPPAAAPPVAEPLIGIPPSAVTETPEWLPEITPEEEAAPEVETTAPSERLVESKAGPALFPAAVISAFEDVTSPLPPEPGIGVAEPVVSPAEPPVVSPAEPAEGLARAEIPDWLQALRPHPEVVEAAVEEEPVETEGPLQGLRSLLPPARAIEAPVVHKSVLLIGAGAASLARAQLLQSLLTQPAQVPRPDERKRGISMGERAQRWLVAAVLLIAVWGILIPPLMGFDVPALTQPATFPAAFGRIEFQHVMNLHTAIQNTSTGDIVLVAFEYGPPEADELDLVAEPILRHLLDQGAHISVVSTQPEGLVAAAGLLGDIAASEEQYTLVSYRPGDATAVSSLLTDADIPPGGGTEGGTRPELILVLTARPAPLRWWVEQTRALGGTPPVVAGVSASLQIATSPYLDASAGQLEGAISGLSGAAAYEAHRGLEGWATQRVNALAAGHVAVVGLMVLGAIICTFGGSRGRKK